LDGLLAYNYDGPSLTNTAHIDIPHEDVNDIAVGPDGTVFLADNDSGLWAYSYDGSSFTNTTHVVEDSGSASSVAISQDGTVFLGNGVGGLNAYSYDGSSFKSMAHIDEYEEGEGDHRNANSVTVDSDGTVFVGYDRGGLNAYSYDGSKFTNIAHINSDWSGEVDVDSDSTIFFIAANIHISWLEAYKFEDNTFNTTDYFIDGEGPIFVNHIVVGLDRTIFVVARFTLQAFAYDGSFTTKTAKIEPGGDTGVTVGADGTDFTANRDNGLIAYTYSGYTAIDEELLKIPVNYAISQNYPNPFNPSTTIEFDLPKFSDVRIEVYNIAGQKIQTLIDKKMSKGNHQVEFNAQNLSSGVYFYRIEAGEFQDVKKMILLH
jgi:WD40 repeat protein